MKTLAFLVFAAMPFAAVACPTGMQFNGNGCSPPYKYTGWDLMRDRRAAIDAIGSDSIDLSGVGKGRFRPIPLKNSVF